ncbi:hypothetical protein [Microlunatus speluncae]|uniref:hypothetical protein n=1 Tax=Microlunatus speluncae TaxID=2594267 RepID=UPI001266789F|nr:hypothetical protein [Microlunatus speluncae]
MDTQDQDHEDVRPAERDQQEADTGPRLGRRTLLGAAGLGTWAVAAAGGLGAGPTTANAEPRQAAGRTPYPDDLPLISGEEFPIGLYWPPPPYQTTLARYQEIKNAGFTFLVGGNYLYDAFITRRAMGFAGQVGLKYLEANDLRLSSLMRLAKLTDDGAGELEYSTAETRKLLQAAVDVYKPQASFAGFNFWDEPTTPQAIENVARGIRMLREIAPNVFPYVNLERGISMNPTRLAAFVEQVDPPVISFDHYPLFNGSIDQTWYADWASVRQAGLDFDLPTWTYLLAVEHLNYRSPTEAELLWQTNVSLAYGCTGILYFTYWTPEAARGEGFAEGDGALITLAGERTARYQAAKKINSGWLSRVGRQLKPLTSESIGVANLLDHPPNGLPAFAPGDYIKETWGDPLIIGRFGSAADDDHRWFLVVNYALDAKATGRVNFGSDVATVERYVPADESYRPVSPRADISLGAGAAVLYRVEVAA